MSVSCYVTEQAGIISMESKDNDIQYVSYTSELQMPDIMKLIQKDLSEPYSIYTYRYFIHNWPKLCFLVRALQKTFSLRYCIHTFDIPSVPFLQY